MSVNNDIQEQDIYHDRAVARVIDKIFLIEACFKKAHNWLAVTGAVLVHEESFWEYVSKLCLFIL